MQYQVKEEENKFILLQEQQEIGYLKYHKEEDYVIQSIFIQEAFRGKRMCKIDF